MISQAATQNHVKQKKTDDMIILIEHHKPNHKHMLKFTIMSRRLMCFKQKGEEQNHQQIEEKKRLT